jgi:hypothetical protein
MVDEPGSAGELARIGPRFPLMDDARILLFVYEANPPEMPVLERPSMPRHPAESVRGSPERPPRKPSSCWSEPLRGSPPTSTCTASTLLTSP